VKSCPAESFPGLNALPFLRAAFLQRCPGVDVITDRETALSRLSTLHRATANQLGFRDQAFACAEQVHGALAVRVDSAPREPVPGADALITASAQICLAIYVADCAAVYFADKKGRAIGLAHSGRKGTELGIVPRTITALRDQFGIDPSDLRIQIAPCIRPPHYEVDIAAEISRQAHSAGVDDVNDCGICTASDPESYYSYRREKGRTGRLLALLALKSQAELDPP
jgi:polyphenol oxidase